MVDCWVEKEWFQVEINLKDYLRFHIIEDKELDQIMILQPRLINSFWDEFGDEVLEKWRHRTPGVPRFKVIRLDQDSELIDPELQNRCEEVLR
jgi:hypothetical protein